MSFGFSIGDFIAVIELAGKIRKEFIGAPSQFENISNEVRSLSIVLQDAETVLSECDEQQKTHLQEITNTCRTVLIDTAKTLAKYIELGTRGGNIGQNVKRVWKKLRWEPEDIRGLRERLTSNITLLNAFVGQISSQATFDARKGIDRLNKRQDDRERRAILDWLTPIDYAPQQSDFIARRQVGTGQWLLDLPDFQRWSQAAKQTLFCPGIPGAGKTILTSIVVDELLTRFENDRTIGIAYVYCNFRQKQEQTAETLIASLLKQLSQKLADLPESVKSLYDKHQDQRTRPSTDELSRTLQLVAALHSRVFILVDALDECQTSEQCRSRLLREIFAVQAQCGANIFATSRHIPEIEDRFNGSISLEIRASPGDVGAFVDGHLNLLPSFVGRSPALQEEVRDAIINVVDGMFLLAQLYMDSLIGKRSPKALREALQKLPAGSEAYDHAYNDAMERIKGQVADQEDLAIQALSWIVNARRLLTSTELQHALAVEVGEPDLDEDNLPQVEDIVSACAGLVTVDQESAIIRLVHYTTQEYFERTQMRWLPISEAGITFTCVIYLSFDAFRSGPCETDEEFEERLQAYPLYNYAAKNWGHHARNCLLSRGELVDFLKSPALVEASSQALTVVKTRDDYSQLFPKHMTGLHLAACFGLEEAITTLLKEPLGPNLRDDWGRSPLWWAAWAGYTAAVQLFLDGGAEADLKDVDNCTPLSIAAKQGNAAIVQLLLDHGAEVDRKDSEGHTALSWAAREGHLAITQLLLDSGAEVDSQSTCGRTPLSKAAEEGQASMVQLLLDRGAGADSRDIRRRTPLSYAAGNGHMAIVNLLLDKGAEFDLRETGFGLTPLSLAARKGHVGVVEQLLQKGAEVDSKAVFWQGEAPLSRAAAAGHAAVVQLLLDSGAEVDLQDSRGRTALMRAAVLGFVVVVQLLLEKGARIDSKDREGGTPLSLAVDQGQTAVVQLLQAFPPPDQVNPTPPGQALSVPVRDGPRVDDI